MSEIELKLQVPAARRAAVEAAVAGVPADKRVRLRAAYYDTPDRRLARAGMALRLRREGRRWLQTLKSAGDDGLTRTEDECVVAPGAAAVAAGDALPAIDPARHAGTATGDRLLALLATAPVEALGCLYRTDIWRRTRQVRSRGGAVVELAFDSGVIVAGDRRLPVCELEVELVAGSPPVVVDTARRWAARHRLWLDSRSKAERGDLLARGLDAVPAMKSTVAPLQRDASLADAQRLLLAACLAQIAANASQVASGPYGDEHVHQLRVGLRRLRTVLRLFDDAPDVDALPAALQSAKIGAAAADWFRRLGAARDAAAVLGPLADRLSRLRAQVAPSGVAASPPQVRPGEAAEMQAPDVVCRSTQAQAVLFALHARIQRLAAVPAPTAADPAVPAVDRPAAAPAVGLRTWFAARLRHWHRQVVRDLRRFPSLDDEAVHRLRKRAKRLRYAAEFAAPLYKPGAVRRFLRPLAQLQDALGALNDMAVAIARFRADAGAATADREAWFALGVLASQREAARAACVPAARAFDKAEPFWKKG